MQKIGVVIASLFIGTVAMAQNIVQPTVQPQDTWTYRNTLEQRPNVWRQSHYEGVVVRNSGSTILIRNAEVGSSNPPTEILLNADWSRFRSINGQETVVSRPLAFPLNVGKSWDLEYIDDHPSNTSHKSEKRKLHYHVVGWEDVDVPAGKFKALKIEADGSWIGEVAPKTGAVVATQVGADSTSTTAQTVNVTTRTVTGRIYLALWYAPEVKRAVKSIDEYYDTGGVRNERTTVELESYKVAN
jgi:hypothetical protein